MRNAGMEVKTTVIPGEGAPQMKSTPLSLPTSRFTALGQTA